MREVQRRVEVLHQEVARVRLQVAVFVVVAERRARDRRSRRDGPQLVHLPVSQRTVDGCETRSTDTRSSARGSLPASSWPTVDTPRSIPIRLAVDPAAEARESGWPVARARDSRSRRCGRSGDVDLLHGDRYSQHDGLEGKREVLLDRRVKSNSLLGLGVRIDDGFLDRASRRPARSWRRMPAAAVRLPASSRPSLSTLGAEL